MAWLFGFSPTVQFDLIGGDVSCFTPGSREKFLEYAKFVTSTAGSDGTVTGAAFRVDGREVAIVGVPAPGVTEIYSGRAGLAVAFGCATKSAGIAAPSFFAHIAEALARTISHTLSVEYESTLKCSTVVAERLQQDEADVRTNIRWAVEHAPQPFAQILSGISPWKRRWLLRSPLEANGTAWPTAAPDPAYELCSLLLGELQRTGAVHIGRHISLQSQDGGAAVARAADWGSVTAHRFVPNGALIAVRG